MTDDELITCFEAQQDPPGGFHHREHVRVAWVYLRRDPVPVALEHRRWRTAALVAFGVIVLLVAGVLWAWPSGGG